MWLYVKINPVIWSNSVRPCVKGHSSVCTYLNHVTCQLGDQNNCILGLWKSHWKRAQKWRSRGKGS